MRTLKALTMKGHEIKNGLILRGLLQLNGAKLKVEVIRNREFNKCYLRVCEPYSLTGEWILLREEKLASNCTLRQLDGMIDKILVDSGF